MGTKLENLVGRKLGLLTVLRQTNSRKYGSTYKRRWICVCECGNETEVDTGSITSGKTSSCGCLQKKSSAENGRKSRDAVRKKTASLNVMKSSYKRNARTRGLDWTLTDDETTALFEGNCFYCGAEPSNNYKSTYYNQKYSGIDRVDNNLGYTKENTVTCCKTCNHAKHTMSQSVFIDWIKKAALHLQRIKSDLERSEVHISHSGVAVDQHYHWQPMNTCPKRVKVQLLTQNGVAVYGSVDVDMTIYAGWAPLPKKAI